MSTPQGFVLDGSVTLAWYFADEADAYADEVGRQLPAVEAIVPTVWHWRWRTLSAWANPEALDSRPGPRLDQATSSLSRSRSTTRRRPTRSAPFSTSGRMQGLSAYDAS